ncbi:MAG: hypothetical protein JW863_11610 [Chitinispirillaceae bacterium]|nr:hypothetical protein [Chitinispirillaceae bacterium]
MKKIYYLENQIAESGNDRYPNKKEMDIASMKHDCYKSGNILLVYLMIIPASVFGHYYKKALVVTNDSSNLTGYVEMVSESKLSVQVHFKIRPDDSENLSVPVDDISYVLFTDDSSEYHRVKYTRRTDSTKTVEYRLAKKLLGGYADLFKLQLPGNEINIVFEHYNTYAYIVKIDTSYYTMDMQEKLEGTRYTIRKGYVGVLKRLFMNDRKQLKNIEKIKMMDAKIIPLFDGLNRAHPDINRKVYCVKERRLLYHSVYANAGITTGFDNVYFPGIEAGYAMKINRPELSRKVYFEAGASMIKWFITEDARYAYRDTSYSITVLKLSTNALYYFNNRTIAPFAGFGGAFVIGTEGLGLHLKEIIGCTVNGRYSVALNAEHLSLKTVMFSISLGFTFNPSQQ